MLAEFKFDDTFSVIIDYPNCTTKFKWGEVGRDIPSIELARLSYMKHRDVANDKVTYRITFYHVVDGDTMTLVHELTINSVMNYAFESWLNQLDVVIRNNYIRLKEVVPA